MNAVQPHALSPYLSLHHRGWLARPDSSRYQVVDGTLLFLDISGFTPLTERLARRGKAGAEELTDHLNVVFGGLIGLAANHGGDVLKFGGDALFILLTGDGHEARGAAAAWDLQIGMARFKRLRTSVGTIPLQASSGLASGPVYLFRAGSVFDELIVAGPTVTTCLQLEKVAEATEVLVDPVAVAAFGDQHCTVAPDRGLLLTSRPDAGPPPASHEALLADPLRGLPSILHDELAHSELGEHRQAVVSFVQFKGVDEMLDAGGPSPVSTALDGLMAAVQEACERHGVTFICTDADLAAGKVMLTAGAPVAHEDDADRMLLAVCEIVAHEGPLTLRAGVNAGRVFAVHIGAPSRRTYSTMGDTTNLAARVMGKSPNGRVLGTRAVLHRARGHFETQAVDPFKVKGKSMLIDAEVVIGPDATATAQVAADAGDLAVPPGRDREAAALAAATRTALAGGVSVVELCGAPGIGKSRLLAHGIAVARDAGLRTVRLEGTAYGAHTPYAAARTPLRELLGVADGDAAAVTDALTRAAAGLEDWLGLLGPVVGVDLPLSTRAARLDPEAAARRRRFVGARLLARLLDKPTLVVVEDSHWLDTATSELLETTLASGELRACAIVCGRRPDPGGFVAAEELHPVRIDLAPISDEAARAVIVAVIAAGGGLTPDAVPALVERAAGNPLLLRELAAAVSAGGDLRALPDTIEGLLAASIDRLAPTDRTILRRLAVLGVSSDLATAARYLDVSGAALHAATGRLAAFVEEDAGRIRFRHALQRAAAYEALPFRVRRDLHARAGDVTREAVGDDVDAVVELLALHAYHAGRLRDCWRLARRAGRLALSRGGPTDALAFYDWAIEAGRRLPDVDLAALGAVHEERGDAAERAGRYDVAAHAYGAARRRRRDDPLAVAELWRKQARMHERRGRYDLALGCATRGRRALRDAPHGERREIVLGRLDDVSGVARLRQGNAAAARTHLSTSVVRLARTSDAPRELAHASYSLAGALVELGRFAVAAELSARALALYEEAGDLVGASTVLNNQGVDAYWTGDWENAAQLLAAGRDMRRELGDVALTAESELNLAELWSDQGRWADAEPLLIDALAIFRAAPRPEGIGLATSDLGRLAARGGDFERAGALLADARVRLQSIGAAGLAYEVGVREAERLVLASQPDAALAAVAEMRALARDVNASHFYTSALARTEGWAAAQRGEPARARGAFAEALRLARESGLRYDEVVTLDAIAHVAGDDDEDGRLAPATLRELGIVALARPPLAEQSHASPTGYSSVTV